MDEHKDEAVALADELGSYSAAARKLGCSGNSIKNWRDEGYGKTKTAKASSELAAVAVPDDAEVVGPSIRCPSCRHLVVVNGDPGDPQHKRAALFEHYKTNPGCEKA